MQKSETPRALGRYEILEKLGTGSFATVWLARKHGEEDLVALKAISRERLEKSARNKVRSNLDSEMAILREFKHPHLVALVEINKCTDYVYLALEYMRGGDLQRLIRSKGRLSEETSRRFMGHLASGLEFLWSKQLIHRDLKPSNLLLTSNDQNSACLKIADFGFARRLESAALADTLCGSPLYMAPEILTGQAYDGKADVWSVGTILYEMLSGRPPFSGQDHRDLLRNIKSTTLRLPHDLILSAPCLELLQRLLRRDPIERIPIDRFANHRWLLRRTDTTQRENPSLDRKDQAEDQASPPGYDQNDTQLRPVRRDLFGSIKKDGTTSSCSQQQQLSSSHVLEEGNEEDEDDDDDDDDYKSKGRLEEEHDTKISQTGTCNTTSSGEFVVVDHVSQSATPRRHKRRSLALAYAEEAVACASTLARAADSFAKKKQWPNSLAVYASALRLARRAVAAAGQALQRSDGTRFFPGGRAQDLEDFAIEQLGIVLDRTVSARSKCEQNEHLPNAQRLVFQRGLMLARSAAAKETLSQLQTAHNFYADASRCLAALLFSFMLSDADRKAILAIIRGPLERALERTTPSSSQHHFLSTSIGEDNDDRGNNSRSSTTGTGGSAMTQQAPGAASTSSELLGRASTTLTSPTSSSGADPSSSQPQLFIGDDDD